MAASRLLLPLRPLFPELWHAQLIPDGRKKRGTLWVMRPFGSVWIRPWRPAVGLFHCALLRLVREALLSLVPNLVQVLGLSGARKSDSFGNFEETKSASE
jgi:hypothetical protein